MEIGRSSPLIQKLFRGLNKADDGLCSLNKKTEALRGYAPEIITLLLYVALHIIISVFHEPWQDEAISWQIAKCASVKDILFTLPHYEGHPPLWHLILLPFAKLGCPYEFSLSLVSLIFSALAMGLLLFKAPFPRIVRLLLPFTYFLFYQYGVVSRPYCIMMAAFMLAAVTYEKRDTDPWRFVLSLMLLCLSSAYGILIAGGITIAWLLELFKAEKFRLLLNKGRTASLICLLILAILLILEIIPAEGTYAATSNNVPDTNNIFVRLLYAFLILPADTCVTNVFSYSDRLTRVSLSAESIIAGIFFGILIWTVVLYIAKKKKTALVLVIPYCLFAMFAAVKYMYLHHVGIALLIFIFWAWITCASKEKMTVDFGGETKRIALSCVRVIGAVFMVISLYWTVSASVSEIAYVYGIGRNEAAFIAENGLDDYRIMVGYLNYYDHDNEGNMTSERIGCDFNHCNMPDSVLAYFDRNIFFNLNGGADDMAYTFHKVADEEDCADLIAKWREQGAPDVIFMPPNGSVGFGKYVESDISAVYEGITDISDYTLVYFSPIKQIWKNTYSVRHAEIYVRTDLAEELGLERPDL
ncbi:MAG: hypothetical protein MR038_07085 [Oscillospiraceae bacterium]|nr:hypothetical protein [Oscillospiraceae bacterium]